MSRSRSLYSNGSVDGKNDNGTLLLDSNNINDCKFFNNSQDSSPNFKNRKAHTMKDTQKNLSTGKSIYTILLEKKVESLLQQLDNSKMFLGMIIHDMRNPAHSIEFSLQNVLKLVKDHFKLLEKDIKFQQQKKDKFEYDEACDIKSDEGEEILGTLN